MNNFQKAVDQFGSIAELARALEVSSPAVVQWRKSGIPPARAIQIETLSMGELKATELIRGCDVCCV